MKIEIWVTPSYFDGEKFLGNGPYTIVAEDGRITSIAEGDFAAELSVKYLTTHGTDVVVDHVAFLMPGLVEGHAHLFLDGAELDTKKRADYLKADRSEMVDTARASIAATYSAGVTLVRDAGDIHGINTQMRAEYAGRADAPGIRSAGRALRKLKRYGSFMAIEATDNPSIEACVDELAPLADDIKVLMTGIIDFKTGQMAGSPQFDIDEARIIVAKARSYGKKTFTHCSGVDGLNIAVDAGLNSIEHGFFMNVDILQRMADKQIAWVPTFSPVAIQRDRPELLGWDADTVDRLRVILDNHSTHLALAHKIGTPIVAGSDAGSYGVPHGSAVVDEIFFADQAGLPLEANLASATSVPRRLWDCESANIRVGSRVDMIALAASPRERLDALRQVTAVYRAPQPVAVSV